MITRSIVWLIHVRDAGAWRLMCIEDSQEAAKRTKKTFVESGARVMVRRQSRKVSYQQP